MKLLIVMALSLAGAALLGCRTHTVVGRSPLKSPDLQYLYGVEKHGASGKAFTARTKKRVYVWISTRKRHDSPNGPVYGKYVTLLDKKYTFVAGDLYDITQWRSNAVSIIFYDYGDGVSRPRERVPSNHIATLSLHLDQRTGKFVESK